MGVDIYASEGATADEVTTYQNEPASPRPSPILGVSPERGTFLRFQNRVAKGDEMGIPLYLDLRDSNGDPIPVNSAMTIELEPAGQDKEMVVSEEVSSHQAYIKNDITEQQQDDNIDAVKVMLKYPDPAPNSGSAPHIDVRDIDDLYLTLDSAAQVDWSKSEAYVESNAVESYGR